MKKIRYIIFILIFTSISIAQQIEPEEKKVCFTKGEVEKIIDQFKNDKKEIEKYLIRDKKLREIIPEIKYEFLEDNKIKQHITIPVYQNSPLEYIVNFKITPKEEVEGWFPMKPWLGIFFTNLNNAEDKKFSNYADAKIGLKIISFSPLNKSLLENIGINVTIGIKSAGLSLSYKFPKPFNNTNLHLFYGYEYSTPINKSFGIGGSLNF